MLSLFTRLCSRSGASRPGRAYCCCCFCPGRHSSMPCPPSSSSSCRRSGSLGISPHMYARNGEPPMLGRSSAPEGQMSSSCSNVARCAVPSLTMISNEYPLRARRSPSPLFCTTGPRERGRPPAPVSAHARQTREAMLSWRARPGGCGTFDLIASAANFLQQPRPAVQVHAYMAFGCVPRRQAGRAVRSTVRSTIIHTAPSTS